MVSYVNAFLLPTSTDGNKKCLFGMQVGTSVRNFFQMMHQSIHVFFIRRARKVVGTATSNPLNGRSDEYGARRAAFRSASPVLAAAKDARPWVSQIVYSTLPRRGVLGSSRWGRRVTFVG